MAIGSKNLIGGGLGVNSIKEINSPDDLYISPKGKEWLKTGVLETDAASYPDATIYTDNSVDYVGIPTPSTGAAGLPNYTRIK